MIHTRSYGASGPIVVLIHGGPGAAGSMAPIARGLEDLFRVLEPFQSRLSATVADHVADLDEVLRDRCAGVQPALVGHSWGAMLALAYAAAHPKSVGPLVLVGCGTFDTAARATLNATLDQRIDPATRRRLERLPQDYPDPNQRLKMLGELTLPLYSYELIDASSEGEPTAGRDQETWQDMVRLQQQGYFPAAFRDIVTPVLMLHGANDPHPGQAIRASLQPHLAQLEYRQWDRCGHYPWMEKFVQEEFFATLRSWLKRRLDPKATV